MDLDIFEFDREDWRLGHGYPDTAEDTIVEACKAGTLGSAYIEYLLGADISLNRIARIDFSGHFFGEDDHLVIATASIYGAAEIGSQGRVSQECPATFAVHHATGVELIELLIAIEHASEANLA